VIAPSVVPNTTDDTAATIQIGIDAGTEVPAEAAPWIVGSDPFDLTLWPFTVENVRYEFTGVTSSFVGDLVNPQPVTVLGGLYVACATVQQGVVTAVRRDWLVVRRSY
jgi:hypothetical protein